MLKKTFVKILGGKVNDRCRKNLIPPDQGWTKACLLSDQGSEKKFFCFAHLLMPINSTINSLEKKNAHMRVKILQDLETLNFEIVEPVKSSFRI